MFEISNFINGSFVATKNYLHSYEPSTGKIWAKVPASTAEDVEKAVDAAKKAFPGWSSTPASKRAEYLMTVANLLENKLDEFANVESRDQGKPFFLARTVDIPRAVLNFRHFATAYTHVLNTSAVQQESNTVNYTTRSPVGVAALISPWNLPLYLLTFKIAPALMTGNTVVCKPSEMTSVTAFMLSSLFKEAGLPPGVANMVFGYGAEAGESLILHRDVSLISFTGSTAIGRHIYSSVAHDLKKLSLELGGKNAAIIFEDADLTKCVPATIRSSFTNQGEVCLATSRVFIQRSVFDEFLKLFVEQTMKLKVGPSVEDGVIVGALISETHLNKVKKYVTIAVEDGGKIQCGHTKDVLSLPPENKNGYYMLPTVITGLQNNSRCMQEEIFGPVTCLVPFDTEQEVINRANNVPYGLSATVWTENSSRLHRVSHQLQVGTVWANCFLVRCLDMPFGGMKCSGLGREGTHESLEFYTELKTICVQV